jgi:hypothetical protein
MPTKVGFERLPLIVSCEDSLIININYMEITPHFHKIHSFNAEYVRNAAAFN